ncbi:MAG: hypothetical protein WCR72_12500 [Bacteroidota bacterium]
MKTRPIFHVFFLPMLFTGLVLLSGQGFAQQKAADQAAAKKTITIHVTKEVDGHTTVIDTTVITEGDFDADAFLQEKGVMDDMPGGMDKMDKNIIIRHRGMGQEDADKDAGNVPDTLIINNDTVIVLTERPEFDMPDSHQGRDWDRPHFNPGMQDGFPPFDAPRFEDMMRGMARSFGLDGLMPFGDMKQIVVKKKNHGKTVTITFEDREDGCCERRHGNRHKHDGRDEERMEYDQHDQGNAPRHEERVIIQGNPDQKVIILKDTDKNVPVKKQKKVIIIREEKEK